MSLKIKDRDVKPAGKAGMSLKTKVLARKNGNVVENTGS
jgi:hypothetical protein